MKRGYLNTIASSNGGRRKRTAPEGREMTLSPPPPGFPFPRYHRAGVGPPPPPLNLQYQPGALSHAPPQVPTPPPPLIPRFHLDQPRSSSSVDTVFCLGVTPHAPRPERGFKVDAPPPANLHLRNDIIDQALKRNNDSLREKLQEMCKRQYATAMTTAEESAAKKLKEADEEIGEMRARNWELETRLASYRTQSMAMADKLKALKETNAALNAALHEATHRRATLLASNQGGGDEEAQSSSLDPEQVVVVRMSCKICWGGPTTMVPWPCRHLCLCKNCATTTNCCPVCHAIFQDCIEVKCY